jgi:3-mercaptopyruvate sulfurtransferase SseA
VLYGGNNNWFASYAYWYFKLYGHDDVKLLDGGRKKWELDSRKLTQEVADRAPTSYTAKDQDTSIRAFRDEVKDAIGKVNLVDVRSPDEFSGKLLAPAHLPQEQSQRPGHIPTAKNIPWSKAANDDGTFKSDDELKSLYEGAGRRPVQRHDRLLPHRRAQRPHVVRAARDPRPAERPQLRRQLDRVGLARRRPHREGRLAACAGQPSAD